MISLLDEVAGILEEEHTVIYRRNKGREVEYVTKNGIIIDSQHALAIAMGEPTRLLADFEKVLAGYGREIIRSSEPNLAMSGLRTVIELYERKICFLCYAPQRAAKRDTLRYFYLNAFIASKLVESRELAANIRSFMKSDPVIKSIKISDFGSDKAEAKAASLLQQIFAAEYTNYKFGNKDGYKKFTRIIHGYAHANHFNFRAAQLRQQPNSDLISMSGLKLGVLIVIIMEALIASADKINDENMRSKIQKKIIRKRLLGDKFMAELKAKKYE